MANHIVRFDPFEDLTRLQREMNRLFDDSARTAVTRPSTELFAPRAWSPAVDIYDDHNSIVVKAELPGLRQEDIDIEVSGDTLTIKGERKFEETETKDHVVRVERSYGSFQRSFTIGVPIQSDKVSAVYKDGVLTVELPKSEEVKTKKVRVFAAS